MLIENDISGNVNGIGSKVQNFVTLDAMGIS